MEIRRNAGFTIVELVVVIVVIGILAAVALPRFLGLQDRAHDAVVEGTQAALASGVVMAHSVWLAEGRDSALDNILVKKELTLSCVGGTTNASGNAVCSTVVTNPSLDVNDSGYPTSHTQYSPATDIANDLGTTGGDGDSACVEVFEFLLSESSVRATNLPAGATVTAAFTTAGAAADSAFEFLARASGTNCTYLYLPDIADNESLATPRTITYNTLNGRVTVSNLSSTGTTSN